MTFEKPVRLLVENTYDFAPGTPVPVGYYRKDLGMWVPDGMGKITDDGKYMEYFTKHFSPCDLNFPGILAENAKSPTEDNTVDDSNKNSDSYESKAGNKGCKIIYHDGELIEDYHLPSFR